MENSNSFEISRRDVLKSITGTVGALSVGGRLFAQPAPPKSVDIQIDVTRQHELSPYLFMQFMEPLGATDGSVEAGWDHRQKAWRADLIEATQQLAPPLLRWGGCFSSYYRWKEAVGPRDQRKPMYNLLWDGIESNQIGTAEFVEFCKLVNADPFMCVNFESDGRPSWMQDPIGQSRFADAAEAAEWVRYCNDPDDSLRISHGHRQPHPIKMWQVGNETSYDKARWDGYDLDTSIKKTIEFAKAMRNADPDIELIGWGDSGWARRMVEEAGEYLDYVAFHHMFNPESSKTPVLRGEFYRRDPDATWDVLMDGWKINDRKIRRVRDNLGNLQFPLAMTECHYSIPGRNRCDVLSTWAAGVSYARFFNNYQRHGDLLKIATAADFCGTRWQNNAVIIPAPKHVGKSYLMPVARVMRLYRHHIGKHAIKAETQNSDLDVVASRTSDKIYLHIINTNRTRAARISVQLSGGNTFRQPRMFSIAEDTTVEISYLNSDHVMQISEKSLSSDDVWEIPAAAVCVIEFSLAKF